MFSSCYEILWLGQQDRRKYNTHSLQVSTCLGIKIHNTFIARSILLIYTLQIFTIRIKQM